MRVISTSPSSEMSKTWERVLSRESASRSAPATASRFDLDSMSMKSMTMIPPMSRSRSWRATSSAASRLLRNTVSSRFDLPDVLARVDVDDRQRLGALDDERAPRGQPDLAVERLVQLLVDEVALEQRQVLGLGVVVLDAVGELGVDREHVVADLVVEVAVVDEHAAVVAVELLAQDPHREVQVAVDEARLVGARRARLDLGPLGDERVDVAAQLVGRDALGGGAHDEPVAVGADLVGDAAQPARARCRPGASRSRRRSSWARGRRSGPGARPPGSAARPSRRSGSS